MTTVFREIRFKYFELPTLYVFLQLLLNHHQMSGLILLQQTVFASSGIQYPNMRTTVIYLVILFAIIPLVITMEDGRTSLRQQQATLFQAFAREQDMIFGLLDTLRQELDRNPTGIFLHVRTAVSRGSVARAFAPTPLKTESFRP